MKKVKIKGEDWELEDKDAALVIVLQDLTKQMRRIADG